MIRVNGVGALLNMIGIQGDGLRRILHVSERTNAMELIQAFSWHEDMPSPATVD